MLFVGRRTQTDAATPLPFDSIVTNKGNRWNNNTFQFTITEAEGLYFIGISVRTILRTQADYCLILSGNRFGGITKSSTSQDGYDTIGHDFLLPLYAADTLQISSRYPVWGAGGQHDTSLSVFSISHSMINNVAFSVAREHSLTGFAEPLQFNTYLYNDGLYFDILTNMFTAPSGGIYFFSFSVGLVAGGTTRLSLYKNFEPFVNILRTATSYTGTDTIGRSVMMGLDEGDIIYIVNEDGQTARSSQMKETSFSGFKYEPRHGNPVSIYIMFNFCCLKATVPNLKLFPTNRILTMAMGSSGAQHLCKCKISVQCWYLLDLDKKMFNLYCIHSQIFHKINYFHKQCIDFKVSVSLKVN